MLVKGRYGELLHDVLSNSSGVSTLSAFRCFVIGIASLTCRKFVLLQRYLMLADIIVNNYTSEERVFGTRPMI